MHKKIIWYGAHPRSGMALERSNTVKVEYYCSSTKPKAQFQPKKFWPRFLCSRRGFGIMSTIAAVEQWITPGCAPRTLHKNRFILSR